MNGIVEIPRRTIGPASVPRLFLGDHGYLAKLGSSMTVEEVAESMRGLLSAIPVGLAAGEPRVVDAALCAMHGRPRRDLMIHADIRITLRGERIRYRHVASTMTTHLAMRGMDLSTDPVLDFLYKVGHDGSDLARVAAHLHLDSNNAASFTADIKRAAPAVVSIGGDWLDLMLVLGRFDLATTGVAELAKVASASGAAVILTTYFGAMVEPSAIDPFLNMIDGLLVPLNRAGFGTLPSLADHRAWIASLDMPVIGMHALSGAESVDEALTLLDEPFVAALVIGASSSQHQAALARAARSYFDRPRS